MVWVCGEWWSGGRVFFLGLWLWLVGQRWGGCLWLHRSGFWVSGWWRGFFFFFLVLMVDYGLVVVVVSGVCSAAVVVIVVVEQK